MADKPEKVFPDPVDWDELYPGRFLKAGEFKGKRVTLTMERVKLHELIGDKGPQIKGVIYFRETEKQLALNKTNGICLRAMFGRKIPEWPGHRITLFPGTWDGDECIRVWGSPDIEADMEVAIALPRKRPFNMTMHAMRKPAGPGREVQTASVATSQDASGAAGDEPTTPDPERAKELLRQAKTLEALKDARKTVWGLYAAARVDVPLAVEFVATTQRETLESQS
jgi:hypothetical protein